MSVVAIESTVQAAEPFRLDELGPISLEELTAQSLAADPDQPIDPDAVPLGELMADGRCPSGLPAWYMPPALAHGGRRHLVVISLIVLAMLAVVSLGFCVTEGFIVLA